MALRHYKKSALNSIRYLAEDAHVITRSLGIPKEILLEIIKQVCNTYDDDDTIKLTFDIYLNVDEFLVIDIGSNWLTTIENSIDENAKIIATNSYAIDDTFYVVGEYYHTTKKNINHLVSIGDIVSYTFSNNRQPDTPLFSANIFSKYKQLNEIY